MNGYSKIRVRNPITTTTKSRSLDFSDLSFSPPQTPKPTTKTPDLETPQEEEDGGGGGERFGVILNRTCSLSSSSSQRFKAESTNTTTIQSAVKRAFSMRKTSSSGAEGYCRIHDQSDHLSPPAQDVATHKRSGKKRGRIIKACFGVDLVPSK